MRGNDFLRVDRRTGDRDWLGSAGEANALRGDKGQDGGEGLPIAKSHDLEVVAGRKTSITMNSNF